MEKILSQFRSLAITLLGFALASHYWALRFLVPWITENLKGNRLLSDLALNLIMAPTLYTVILGIPLSIYLAGGWKWLNRRIDFSGSWICEIRAMTGEDRKSTRL